MVGWLDGTIVAVAVLGVGCPAFAIGWLLLLLLRLLLLLLLLQYWALAKAEHAGCVFGAEGKTAAAVVAACLAARRTVPQYVYTRA